MFLCLFNGKNNYLCREIEQLNKMNSKLLTILFGFLVCSSSMGAGDVGFLVSGPSMGTGEVSNSFDGSSMGAGDDGLSVFGTDTGAGAEGLYISGSSTGSVADGLNVYNASTAAGDDSIFVYNPDPGAGLHVALMDSAGTWRGMGQLCASDYGTWGVEKRMYHPSLCRARDGSWRLVFQVNDHAPLFAASYSKDLITWRPQDYPRVSTSQCLEPVVKPMDSGFNVFYKDGDGQMRRLSASGDFRKFSKDMAMPFADVKMWQREHRTVDGRDVEGQAFAVAPDVAPRLRQHFEELARDRMLSSERMHDDAVRFASLPPTIEARLTVDMNQQKTISDKLIGVFFEDISYAADGGLYAELVQNRDFEYTEKDHRGWTATTAWHSSSPIATDTVHPLHPNNPHYAIMGTDTLWNEGWGGILVEQGMKYDFSMFTTSAGGRADFEIQLIGHDGTVLARETLRTRASDWQQYSAVLTATASDPKARLALIPIGDTRGGAASSSRGTTATRRVCIDMVSLFPQATFMNRKNGLRRDLAQAIADLKPKFIRFPGGCMSHGQGLANIYHWHHTVGPLQARKPDLNIWNYHQTRGLGFYEYFQFCEDVGAEPLPVLAAGVPCQNSAANAEGVGGQQGGIPMDEMPAYVEEICNLIEWANGDPATNQWARLRAEAGHPEPFHLKYLGLGNEDIISTVFEERYEMICKAVRTRYPDIKICGTAGPFHAPSADYAEGWDFMRRHPDLQYMADEHYYEGTGWLMHHRDYYDRYPRGGVKVYLGEWAASTRDKRPNIETALAEALYLTDIERNGDVVEMTSYAPLLSKDGNSNWNPDMIYFTNADVRVTPAYEVQRLFSCNSGDRWVQASISVLTTLPASGAEAMDGAARPSASGAGAGEGAAMPSASGAGAVEGSATPSASGAGAVEGSATLSIAHRVGASLVVDSRTGRRYLKLVNALPRTLQIAVDGLSLPPSVTCEQLTGAVDDQRARATTITTDAPTTLPPYTFRVIAL